MSERTDPVSHVRIMRCGHGTNYVTLGPVTLALTDGELILIDRAIHKLAQRTPELQRALYQALCANNEPDAAGPGRSIGFGVEDHRTSE